MSKALDWHFVDTDSINPELFGLDEVTECKAARWTLDEDIRCFTPPHGWEAAADLIEYNPVTGKYMGRSEWWIFIAQ